MATGHYIRAEYNIVRDDAKGGIIVDGSASDTYDDLGGGLVDVWEQDNPASMYGIGPGATPAPSCGRNTLQGNDSIGGIDVYNGIGGTPQPEIKAENNFWNHSTVSEVLSSDVSGNVDVNPLGVDID